MRTATSIEESKKLLSLGIDPETADMYISNYGELWACPFRGCERRNEESFFPAWSLSAICELMPATITTHTIPYHDERDINLRFVKGAREWSVGYGHFRRVTNPDLFAACIDLIEQLVEGGYIKTKKV